MVLMTHSDFAPPLGYHHCDSSVLLVLRFLKNSFKKIEEFNYSSRNRRRESIIASAKIDSKRIHQEKQREYRVRKLKESSEKGFCKKGTSY